MCSAKGGRCPFPRRAVRRARGAPIGWLMGMVMVAVPFAVVQADARPELRAVETGRIAPRIDPRIVERLRDGTDGEETADNGEGRSREQAEQKRETRQRSAGRAAPDGGLRRPGLTAQARLDHYREYARYPHLQRPLYDSHLDLIHPYAPRGQTLVVHRDAQGKRVESDLPCRLTPERRIAVGTGPFGVTLRCGTESRAEPVQLESAALFLGLNPGEKPRAGGRLDARPAREGGYRFQVTHGASDWGWITMEVRFNHEGVTHRAWTQWESTPEPPAEFLVDEITYDDRDGHLFVRVPVDVHRPGVYEIHANLQEAGGARRYIAQTGGHGELEAGRQTVHLRFFGKVLHDRGIDGPYVVRMLRGYRVNTPVGAVSSLELDRALMRGGAGLRAAPGIDRSPPIASQKAYLEPVESFALPTRFRASRFSDQEWSSPAKERRLQLLERMARD